MHLLTTNVDTTSSLLIDAQMYNRVRGYQQYRNVSVGDSTSGYMLHVKRTSQDVSTLHLYYGMSRGIGLYRNSGRAFSTMDHDVLGQGCSRVTGAYAGGGGGWWFGGQFGGCSEINLNALYGVQRAGGITMYATTSFATNPMMGVKRN
jgi:hypothetical protein